MDKVKQKGSFRKKLPHQKAHETDKNALLFTKYKLGQRGWRFADFQSKKGFPRTGIIDMIAFKLDRKDHDKLKIILFQVKGGSARMDEELIKRLQGAIQKVEVAANWSEKPKKSVMFDWEPTDEEFSLHKS